MTTLDFSPLFRSTVGFDRLFLFFEDALRRDTRPHPGHYFIVIRMRPGVPSPAKPRTILTVPGRIPISDVG